MPWKSRSVSPPECVKDVMVQLMQKDLISNNQRSSMLLEECARHRTTDPALEMDLRHAQAKEVGRRVTFRRSHSRIETYNEMKRLVAYEDIQAKQIKYKNKIFAKHLEDLKKELERESRKDLYEYLPPVSAPQVRNRRSRSSIHINYINRETFREHREHRFEYKEIERKMQRALSVNTLSNITNNEVTEHKDIVRKLQRTLSVTILSKNDQSIENKDTMQNELCNFEALENFTAVNAIEMTSTLRKTTPSSNEVNPHEFILQRDPTTQPYTTESQQKSDGTCDHLPSIYPEESNKKVKSHIKSTDLRVKITINKQRKTIKSFWIAWRNYVHEKKITKEIRKKEEERLMQIEKFVAKISEKANKSLRKRNNKIEYDLRNSPYLQSTCKLRSSIPVRIRKDEVSLESVVAQQKAKLKEQEKIISSLKLEQIKIASNKSTEQTKVCLEDSMHEVSVETRRKLNYLKSIFPSILDKNYYKQRPPFLVQMELRQQERMRRKEEIKEKTKQKILEQQRLQQEKERELKAKLAEEKRIEHELKILQIQEQTRMRAQNELAKEFCRKRRLRMAFQLFKKLIQHRECLTLSAETYCNQRKLRHSFNVWYQFYEEQKKKRFEEAAQFHKYIVIRNAWNLWQQQYLVARQNRQVADDFNDLTITSRAFRCWHNITLQNYHVLCLAMEFARIHHERRILSWCIGRWRKLNDIRDAERRTERRKEALRKRVRLVVPDFQLPVPLISTVKEATDLFSTHSDQNCVSFLDV